MSENHTLTYRFFGRVKKIHDPMPHQWAYFYLWMFVWIFLPSIIMIPIIILTGGASVVWAWVAMVMLNLIWDWATISKS